MRSSSVALVLLLCCLSLAALPLASGKACTTLVGSTSSTVFPDEFQNEGDIIFATNWTATARGKVTALSTYILNNHGIGKFQGVMAIYDAELNLLVQSEQLCFTNPPLGIYNFPLSSSVTLHKGTSYFIATWFSEPFLFSYNALGFDSFLYPNTYTGQYPDYLDGTGESFQLPGAALGGTCQASNSKHAKVCT